ncbi:MAG: hypothetical protein HY698_17565 [Deltaproteobacteria bacterium]|nr:hypothetical protein [Deltaproteobacteria bacterium]
MRLLLLVIILAASHSEVHAAPNRGDGREEDKATSADAHLERGLARYASKDYQSAIAEFQAGYKLEPRPEFLYAWAQAERLSGDCPSAIVLYERFLATSPPGMEAEAASKNLARCQEALKTTPNMQGGEKSTESLAEGGAPVTKQAGEQARGAPETVSTKAGAEKRSWIRDPLGGALMAGGVVGLAVGGGFFYLSVRDESALAKAATYKEHDERLDRARSRRTIAGVGFASAAALLAAGVIRYALVQSDHEGAPPLGLGVSSESLGIVVIGRF